MIKMDFDTDYPDRAVYFDQDTAFLKLVQGEKVFYTTRNVVDIQQTQQFSDASKQGNLTVTNLRTIFHLDNHPTTNISVGYNTVSKILVGNIDNSAASQKQTIVQQDRTLVLVCQDDTRKYRFEFLPRGSRQIFDIIQSVYRAYDTSRAFRITRTRQTLNNYLLPQEFIESSMKDVQMISQLSSQPVAGVLQFTNNRFIWFNPQATQYNVLVPYLDIKMLSIQSIKIDNQDLKCVHVQTQQPENSQQSFDIALNAFTVPPEQLYEELLQKIQNFKNKNVNFGVQVTSDEDLLIEQQKSEEGLFSELKRVQQQDSGQLLKKQMRNVDRVLDYVQQQKVQTEIEFDPDLGLAFEKCGAGISKWDLQGI